MNKYYFDKVVRVECMVEAETEDEAVNEFSRRIISAEGLNITIDSYTPEREEQDDS